MKAFIFFIVVCCVCVESHGAKMPTKEILNAKINEKSKYLIMLYKKSCKNLMRPARLRRDRKDSLPCIEALVEKYSRLLGVFLDDFDLQDEEIKKYKRVFRQKLNDTALVIQNNPDQAIHEVIRHEFLTISNRYKKRCGVIIRTAQEKNNEIGYQCALNDITSEQGLRLS